MLRTTLSRSFLLAVFSLIGALATQGQVPLWLGKMQQVKLFEHKRSDLIRILGEPDDDGNTGGDAAYYFDWGHLFVLSVDEVCNQKNEDYPGDVPKNKERVGELRLVINADRKIRLADLGLKVAGFRVTEPVNYSTGAISKVYVNPKLGRLYETRTDGTVEMIAYIPSYNEILSTCK